MRFAVSSLIALAALTTFAPAAGAGEETKLPFKVIRSGNASIPIDEVVGDVLAIDAKVEIAGLVRGHLYAVDSELDIRSTAVILQSITVQRGTMRVEEGAVLPPEGSVQHAKPSTVAVALMKSVLPFERFSPEDSTEIAALAEWSPGLGLEAKKELENPPEVLIAGMARLSFVSGKVKGAFQRGYRGARGTVLFTGVKCADEATARALLEHIESAIPKSKISLSVRTALGGGAHWYFQRKHRHNMLWRKGAWFFAVETKLASDEATSWQERQFNDQVLKSLRLNLARTRPSATRDGGTFEGVTR